MKTVNVKELKSKLSAYLREVGRGEEFLVTDRGTVVAKLSGFEEGTKPAALNPLAKAAALGARLPLRDRRPSDYRRSGPPSGLTGAQIDALLDEARAER